VRAVRPLAETLGLMTGATLLAALVGPGAFALATPLAAPWTLVTSVYAHAGPLHLGSNAVVVALAGLPVALTTTRARFHAFFVATGALAGLAQVLFAAALGRSAAVVGASGAAFALVGYVIAANPVTGLVGRLARVPPRVAVALVAVVALGLTLAVGGRGAVAAHAVGAALGLLAGRERVLAGDRRAER
jgi:membrane associated rhomboid family serine protease